MSPHRSGPPNGGVNWHEFETPTAAVTSAVAAATNRSETELPPLHGTVDPDALRALLESGDDGTRFTFSYAGVRVALDSDGTVQVDP